jgi:hypothetical protein
MAVQIRMPKNGGSRRLRTLVTAMGRSDDGFPSVTGMCEPIPETGSSYSETPPPVQGKLIYSILVPGATSYYRWLIGFEGLTIGSHRLTIQAQDNLGNSNQAQIEFQVTSVVRDTLGINHPSCPDNITSEKDDFYAEGTTDTPISSATLADSDGVAVPGGLLWQDPSFYHMWTLSGFSSLDPGEYTLTVSDGETTISCGPLTVNPS